MGGKAVYDVLRQQHPHLPFLFSSGYSMDAIHTGFVLKEGIELIQKPYAPEALLRRVRHVLDTAPKGPQ
jgi:CheY-like chemotaxis protein